MVGMRGHRCFKRQGVGLLIGFVVCACSHGVRVEEGHEHHGRDFVEPLSGANPNTIASNTIRAAGQGEKKIAKNVLGTALESCSTSPMTGYFRNGLCTTAHDDTGRHVVCAEMTEVFLQFTRSRGNDLTTPRGGFPGLRPGHRWCLCALRWLEAYRAGVAPPVLLTSTHERTLQWIDMAFLQANAKKEKIE